MNSKNLKTILSAIRNMVQKNRVAYKDYLGEETVDEVICEGVYTGGQVILPIKNPRLFKAGDTYQVSIDGVVSIWVCKIFEQSIGIGPYFDYVVEYNKEPSDPTGMWMIFYRPNKNDGGYALAADSTSFTGKTFVVSQSITRKKYDIKKLPEELLPDATVKKIHTHNNKDLLDELSWDDYNSWNEKSNFSGDYNDLYNQPYTISETLLGSGALGIPETKEYNGTFMSTAISFKSLNKLVIGQYYLIRVSVFIKGVLNKFSFYSKYSELSTATRGFKLGNTGITNIGGYFADCRIYALSNNSISWGANIYGQQVKDSSLWVYIYDVSGATSIPPQNLPFIGNNGLQYGIVRAKAKTDQQTLPIGADADGCLWAQAPGSVKNPNALTIKIGSTTITYDGSSAQTVEIADGSEVSY